MFTRYHEAGKTKIRNHKYGKKAKTCRNIVGYDANALYPSTFLQDMSCGKEKLVNYEDIKALVPEVLEKIQNNTFFGYVKM